MILQYGVRLPHGATHVPHDPKSFRFIFSGLAHQLRLLSFLAFVILILKNVAEVFA
jgi:hypothetical protein